MSKIRIKTYGRDDLENLWKKSDVLDGEKRERHPFLVFLVEENEIIVKEYKYLKHFINLDYADDTRIMVQWEGNWRSDFFHFSFKEIKEAYKKKED